MPNPSFRVYLGNMLKGEMKRDENVLTIENVPAGSQRLVVEALNSSGEIIARKEVSFQTVASSSPVELSAIPTAEKRPSASRPVAEAAPAPAPVTTLDATTLPQTGSSAPRVGLAGLALILAGVLVSRKAKR
jgi:LPXTG-motif cell wall-anchored protein